MTKRAAWLGGWLAAGALVLVGCSGGGEPTDKPSRTNVSMSVAPLSLDGIVRACYDIEVVNGDSEIVWARGNPGPSGTQEDPDAVDSDALCSDQYGNAEGGDIFYVGPCDASEGAATHQITLWIDSLWSAPTHQLHDYNDPCPSGCSLAFDCLENRDVPVVFNLTIVRRASQGFFDIGVDFQDIFCSAKLDCTYDDAGTKPITGLFHDTAPGQTVVMGFACSAGPSENKEDGTVLHLSDLRVHCGDESFGSGGMGGNTNGTGESGQAWRMMLAGSCQGADGNAWAGSGGTTAWNDVALGAVFGAREGVGFDFQPVQWTWDPTTGEPVLQDVVINNLAAAANALGCTVACGTSCCETADTCDSSGATPVCMRASTCTGAIQCNLGEACSAGHCSYLPERWSAAPLSRLGTRDGKTWVIGMIARLGMLAGRDLPLRDVHPIVFSQDAGAVGAWNIEQVLEDGIDTIPTSRDFVPYGQGSNGDFTGGQIDFATFDAGQEVFSYFRKVASAAPGNFTSAPIKLALPTDAAWINGQGRCGPARLVGGLAYANCGLIRSHDSQQSWVHVPMVWRTWNSYTNADGVLQVDPEIPLPPGIADFYDAGAPAQYAWSEFESAFTVEWDATNHVPFLAGRFGYQDATHPPTGAQLRTLTFVFDVGEGAWMAHEVNGGADLRIEQMWEGHAIGAVMVEGSALRHPAVFEVGPTATSAWKVWSDFTLNGTSLDNVQGWLVPDGDPDIRMRAITPEGGFVAVFNGPTGATLVAGLLPESAVGGETLALVPVDLGDIGPSQIRVHSVTRIPTVGDRLAHALVADVLLGGDSQNATRTGTGLLGFGRDSGALRGVDKRLLQNDVNATDGPTDLFVRLIDDTFDYGSDGGTARYDAFASTCAGHVLGVGTPHDQATHTFGFDAWTDGAASSSDVKPPLPIPSWVPSSTGGPGSGGGSGGPPQSFGRILSLDLNQPPGNAWTDKDPDDGLWKADPQDEGDQDPIWQYALYFGNEQLTCGGLPCNKRYFNLALGITPSTNATNCWVDLDATASQGEFKNGWTPAGAVYPIIRYSVQLTDDTGALVCRKNPLDPTTNSRVMVRNTTLGGGGEQLCYAYAGEDPDTSMDPVKTVCNRNYDDDAERHLPFHWVRVGENRNCAGTDLATTEGSYPNHARCTAEAVGQVAICNQGGAGGGPSCGYRSTTAVSCSVGGASGTTLYTCAPN